MISTFARSLNKAITDSLLARFHELRGSLVAENDEELLPLDQYIQALEGVAAAAPKDHFLLERLRQAIVQTDADEVRLLIADLAEQHRQAPAKQSKHQDTYEFARLALNELSQEIGLNLSLDTQWHAHNEHLLQVTQTFMDETNKDFSCAVHAVLPEIYVFNHEGHAAFDFAAMASARFHGLLFVNRADITGPETFADILAHHAGVAFASGWLATDPTLLGHRPGTTKSARSHQPLDRAANLLLSAIGSAWQAIWSSSRALSERTTEDMRTTYQRDAQLSMQNYLSQMRALAQEYKLATQLQPIAVITESMMENSGISISSHLEKLQDKA